jgi:hypothetical protein
MSKVLFTMEAHTTIDKAFEISGDYISMYVDYDDVNHMEVDAAAETILEILNKHWDEGLFKEKYKTEVIRKWEQNYHNLQIDYESYEDYLQQHNI